MQRATCDRDGHGQLHGVTPPQGDQTAGQKVGENISRCDNKFSDEFFDDIRRTCEGKAGANGSDVCPDPNVMAPHRREQWPNICNLPTDVASIYYDVRNTGVPNAVGLKRELPSKLNLSAWDEIFGRDSRHSEMLAFVKYGSPWVTWGPYHSSTNITTTRAPPRMLSTSTSS